jgi:hypothetical protein
MRPQRLPGISRGSPEGGREGESVMERFSYYKAMSELKEVNHKV